MSLPRRLTEWPDQNHQNEEAPEWECWEPSCHHLQRSVAAEKQDGKTKSQSHKKKTISLKSCCYNDVQHCSKLQEWVCPLTGAEQGYAGEEEEKIAVFRKSNINDRWIGKQANKQTKTSIDIHEPAQVDPVLMWEQRGCSVWVAADE